jgi:hypothetical protein
MCPLNQCRRRYEYIDPIGEAEGRKEIEHFFKEVYGEAYVEACEGLAKFNPEAVTFWDLDCILIDPFPPSVIPHNIRELIYP